MYYRVGTLTAILPNIIRQLQRDLDARLTSIVAAVWSRVINLDNHQNLDNHHHPIVPGRPLGLLAVIFLLECFPIDCFFLHLFFW
ncbi:hypothetical protein M407DRAFT_118793 [Tulasnella calospora MUT 4182]|uniref:Uncharacterized protein n=1 Tax=Tulasnella calospora MUT 4182 TaxID=1051891 RepID=A0A0C3ME60_9AGAM|nr:hypothetical protein M407DRAFT_118793 [Tulasnella calospora MUT 4182]